MVSKTIKTSFPATVYRHFQIDKADRTSTRISAGIFKQLIGARNLVGIVLSYGPARLHSLAELVSWNRFLGSLNV